MSANTIKKNYIYNLIYHLLVMVVPIITTPYVSRILLASGVGAHSYTFSVVNYFALVVNLGIASYGQLQISKYRDDKNSVSKTFYELVLLRFVVTLIVAIAYFVVVIQNCSLSYKSLYYAHFLYILAYSLDITWFLQGLEEFKKIVVRNIIVKFSAVILIFALVKEPSDLVLYAILLNGSTLLGNVSIWCFLPRYLKRICFRNLNIFSHLKPCLIYFIPTISTTIYLTLDKTMIGWIANGSAENGFYEQAHKIEQMIVTFLTSLSVVTMPRIAYLYEKKLLEEMNEKLRETMNFILFLSFPMCFGLIAVSDFFVPLFLGSGYERCIPLLKIFSLLLIVVGMNNAVGKQVLMAIGRQKQYNKCVLIGCLVNIIFNAILIPKYLAFGAAIASVLAEFVILLLFIRASSDFVGFKWILKRSIKYLVASVLMFLIVVNALHCLNMNWMNCLTLCMLGAICYLVLVLLLRDEFCQKYLSITLKSFFKKKG